ncbi:MAG: SUMF1/EgtB/PvdO family nonheme iron enzyme, partial [Saprospiraceae bacterium]|nr:SUMF1/EgtB/PvdO family nonheme iron enzyme [Saprospiraceae bacterium]
MFRFFWFALLAAALPATAQPPVHDLVRIEGGTFLMGDQFNDEPGNNAERPVHSVAVSTFYLDKTEVSFEAYDAFCLATGRDTLPAHGWGRGRQPVFNVSWYDAVLYCNWRSTVDGYTPVYTIDSSAVKPLPGENAPPLRWQVSADWTANGYRLPTEAEWEYAARALDGRGGAKIRFATGADTISPASANYNPNAPEKPYYQPGPYRRRTVGANDMQANSLGLRHMSGNVWEWCWDWFNKSWYAQSEGAADPRGPDFGHFRICRGGSFNMPPAFCRAANR